MNLEIIKQLGAEGMWAIIIYKGLDIIEVVVVFLMIGFGLYKAWPAIKKAMEDF